MVALLYTISIFMVIVIITNIIITCTKKDIEQAILVQEMVLEVMEIADMTHGMR